MRVHLLLERSLLTACGGAGGGIDGGGAVVPRCVALRSRVIAALLLTSVLSVFAGGAQAQSRPTSDEVSILSGRTMGNGEVVLAAAIGWPGFWAQATFAPTSRFNLGVRATVLYGSPLMGFGAGIGGELSVPMRLHVHGHDRLDVSIFARPFGVVGEGVLVGQQMFFADEVGFGIGSELGGLLGYSPRDGLTLTFGVAGLGAYVDVPDSSGAQHAVGAFFAMAGVEINVSRETMLFVDLQGGYGLRPANTFDGAGLLRVAIGAAYLL